MVGLMLAVVAVAVWVQGCVCFGDSPRLLYGRGIDRYLAVNATTSLVTLTRLAFSPLASHLSSPPRLSMPLTGERYASVSALVEL
jgi:hypothetical protein